LQWQPGMNGRHTLRLILLPLCAAGLGLGCFGVADTAVGGAPGLDPSQTTLSQPFVCAPSAAPASLPLRRLSHAQRVNVITDLLRWALPSDASNILTAVATPLSQLPPDSRVGAPGERRGGFSVSDQTLQQALTDASYELAVALGKQMTSSSARLQRLLGTCATDTSATNDASCLEAFVRRFGARVFRRPLDDGEVAFLLEGTSPGSVTAPIVAEVVGLLFSAPAMMFVLEHGTDNTAEVAPLSAYELASRLSFHFWHTLPDDALWASASTGELLTPSGYQAQVQRLAGDPRARGTWQELWSEWFSLHELEELNGASTDPVFLALAGPDLPNADTREAAISDVLEMADWTQQHQGSLSSLLLEKRSFTADPLLARLYGAPVWDKVSEPPMPTSSRAGLFTRVAFLATGTANTRPIIKGARIRNSFMCENIQLPPGNVAAVTPKPSTTATTREVVEVLTQSSDSCAGCHKTRINPLGFSTENFDALGRERTVQILFDAQGNKTGERPVNTVTQPFLTPDDATTSADATDMTRLLDDSGRVHSCFARQFFRFSHSRIEDDFNDGCELAQLEKAALSDKPLTELFTLPALEDGFKTRSFR
jgi:hypothetical protein